MNRIVLFAMLAALTATSAYAQQRYDPAIPRGMTEQPVQPAGELAKPEPGPLPPRLVQNERRHARDADARHCLDQATNNKGIHRCSLKYRSSASRAASVKRAAAKPAAPPPAPAIEITKPPADIVKPGAPRPGDAAKAADLVKPVDVSKPSAVPKAAEASKAAEPPKPPAPGTPPPPPAKAPEPAKK